MEERKTNVFLKGNLGYVAKGFEILGCSRRHVFLREGRGEKSSPNFFYWECYTEYGRKVEVPTVVAGFDSLAAKSQPLIRVMPARGTDWPGTQSLALPPDPRPANQGLTDL